MKSGSELDEIFKDRAANIALIRDLYLIAFGRRERSYRVYGNGSIFRVLECDEDGGGIVVDEIHSQLTALLIAELLNLAAAIAGCQPDEDAPMRTPTYGRVS
jgi:hypothetical protein